MKDIITLIMIIYHRAEYDYSFFKNGIEYDVYTYYPTSELYKHRWRK